MVIMVKKFAEEHGLWQQIVAAVETILQTIDTEPLIAQIAKIPVRPSRATRSLGMYVSKLGEPVCIRLQFAQEETLLRQTFLHEVAHTCDHLSHQAGGKYRRAHGPGWRQWAHALGISPERCGKSEAVADLHRQRLKLVAICQKCGAEFRRVRRLNRRGRYIHSTCGGRLRPV